MKNKDFLERDLRVGDWVAIAEKQGSAGSRQKLALIYELGEKRIKVINKYLDRIADSYVLKTEHMAILDKSKIPESIKKEFISYYLEKFREGKFIWQEEICGTYF